MLSKAKIKHIKSLQIKKFRKEYGEFLVEGAKSVLELIRSDYKVLYLLVTSEFQEKYKVDLADYKGEIYQVSEKELSEIGSLENNNSAIAIAQKKENQPFSIVSNEFVLALDTVKDPGNLGTIIRIADWYGIKKMICSEETAEFYNPKVISSTMGSFTRISVFYTNLHNYLLQNKEVPVLGAMLNGQPINKLTFPSHGIILMGNESSGIQSGLQEFITLKITIPRIGDAESLNVAVATGIICDRIFNK